jgi:hypothetical protein
MEIVAQALGARCPETIVELIGVNCPDAPAAIAALRRKEPGWFGPLEGACAPAESEEPLVILIHPGRSPMMEAVPALPERAP